MKLTNLYPQKSQKDTIFSPNYPLTVSLPPRDQDVRVTQKFSDNNSLKEKCILSRIIPNRKETRIETNETPPTILLVFSPK